MSETESTTNDQDTEEEEVEDEGETPTKVIKTSKTVQEDYKKMVEILQKQTGIKDKDLEGMSWKEKFDKLSFFAEHSKKSIPKNKPPAGQPLEPGKTRIEGITIKENPTTGRRSYVIDPTNLFKNKNKE